MALPAHVVDPMRDAGVSLKWNVRPIIAQFTKNCIDAFERSMAIPAIIPDPMIINDQRVRFTIWASNMNVLGPPNSSLDYRLRYNLALVNILRKALNSIIRFLAYLRPVDDALQIPISKEGCMSCFGQLHVMAIEGVDCFCDKNGDCSQGLRNISSINRVRHSVTELFSLSSAIQESVDGSRVIEVSEYDSTEEISKAVAGLRTRTESYIRSRFPDTEETLLFALVEADVLRLRRLFYQRSFRKCKFYRVRDLQSGSTGLQHHMSSSRVDFSTPQDGLARKIMDNRPSLPFVLTIGLNSTKQANAGDPLPYRAHTATRATWESSKLGENEPRPSFPAAPRAHECLYCGAAGEFKGTLNPEEWKEHLLRDLEPFTCLFPRGIQTNRPKTECSTFETIEAWINHMQDYHVYHLWECRCTSHGLKIYKSEAEFQEHVHWDHRVLRKAPERYISPHRISKLREIVRCPFGDGFSVTGDGDPSRPFPNEAFHRHVAVHMMEIALLILESFPRDDEDDCNIAR